MVAFVGFTVVSAGAAGLWVRDRTERDGAASARQGSSARLAALARLIRSEIAVGVEDVRLLAGAVEDEGAAGLERHRVSSALLSRFAREHGRYDQVRLLSASGREIARVNHRGAVQVVPESSLQDKGDRYYFKEAMDPGAARSVRGTGNDDVYVSRMDLNVEQGEVEYPPRVMLRFARRVGPPERPAGLAVLNVMVEALLEPVRPALVGPGGELVVVGGGGWVVRLRCGDGDRCRYRTGTLADLAPSVPDAVLARVRRGGEGTLVTAGSWRASFRPLGAGPLAADWRLLLLDPRAPEGAAAAPGAVVGAGALLAVLVGLAAALGIMGARALTRPLRDVEPLVGHGGLARGGDEIHSFAQAVRASAREAEEERADLERKFKRADRLASLGILAATLAHEVGNPLGSMKTALQVHLRQSELSPRTRTVIERVVAEVDRLTSTLERIRGFARASAGTEVRVTPREIFQRICSLYDGEAHRRGMSLRAEGDAQDHVMVLCAERLEQALVNLVVNSLQAGRAEGGSGEILLGATRADGELRLTVADSGPGIPPEVQGRVFDPFYTTKPDGTGLGLPIVREVARDLGGKVDLETRCPGGTRVTLSLPISGEDAA